MPQEPEVDAATDGLGADDVQSPAEEALQTAGDRARELGELLAKEPYLRDYVEKVLAAQPGQPNADSWDRLAESLNILLGSQLSELILIVLLATQDSEDYLDALAALGTVERAWLQGLCAVFGRPVQEIYAVWREQPRGWRVASRQVLNDVNSGRWVIQLDITTFDGTTTNYVETPNSLLSLAELIVDTLAGIPPELRSAAMDSARITTFRNTYNRLFDGALQGGVGAATNVVTSSDSAEIAADPAPA